MKSLTRKQVEGRKEKAARFVRDVLDDPDRAAEIEDESIEDYAERRRFQIANPQRRKTHMTTKQEFEQRIQELEEENEELQARLDDISQIAFSEDDSETEGDDDELGEE